MNFLALPKNIDVTKNSENTEAPCCRFIRTVGDRRERLEAEAIR